jgi:hypothetical protein
VNTRLVDITYWPVGEHARDASEHRSQRKDTAPAARVTAGALFDYDDIIRAGDLNSGRPKMAGRTGWRVA